MLRKQTRVKKYFIEHPEVLEELKVQLLQYSDANFHLDDEEIPNFHEFLARNRKIAEYYKKADGNKRRTSYHKPLYKKLGFVVPVTIVLLACCFLAFTTTGKALAESIYRTVVHWFDDSVDIQYGPGTTFAEFQDKEILYYDSPDEVRSLLNIKIAQNNRAVQLNQIELKQDEGISSDVTSTYILDSDEFVIIQTNFAGETLWNSNLQFNEGETVDITVDGVQYVGYILNNYGYAIAYTEKMSIQITSDGIDYDRFVNFLEGMVIE